MATMLDVAKKAGVSKATVSRVLNNPDIVSDETRECVFKAIRDTGYQLNLLAKQLATQKTNLIGFVMTNGLYNGSYFSSLIYHAATFSEKYHHQLVLADGKHSAETEREAIHFLLNMKCAGIIVYPEYLTLEQLDEIIVNQETPIILLNRHSANPAHYCISMNHYQSGLIMMDYLLNNGHKRIAYISGKPDSYTNKARFAAYECRLKEHHIALQQSWLQTGDWSLDSGYQAAINLLKVSTEFTAVFAANDNMAIGAMKAFSDANCRVPEDISIIGFDNSDISQYLSPALTTMDVPINIMVENAILHILKLPQIHFKPLLGSLIIRQSVANLN